MRAPLSQRTRALVAAAVAGEGSSVFAARARVARATVFRALRGDRVCDATVHCLTVATRERDDAGEVPDDIIAALRDAPERWDDVRALLRRRA